jgi:hypothetical protein
MANAHVLLDMEAMIACNQVRTRISTLLGLAVLVITLTLLVCGSLADGKDRPMRTGNSCDCEEGWGGINCNVCQNDKACNALMPTGDGGVCYTNGEVVKENYQMCDVTNRKIVDLLDPRKPQVTFTCNAPKSTCDFQCEFIIIPVLGSTNFASLGRSTRILLLHSEQLHVERSTYCRSEQYRLRVQECCLQMYP